MVTPSALAPVDPVVFLRLLWKNFKPQVTKPKIFNNKSFESDPDGNLPWSWEHNGHPKSGQTEGQPVR